jgi:squalene-hopene/tetraprenyl-beta-curcumene cyclase
MNWMLRCFLAGIAMGGLIGVAPVSGSLTAAEQPTTPAPKSSDIEAAIERGLGFLSKAQNSNGWWSTPDQPAVTALVLTAFNQDPKRPSPPQNRTSELNRAYDYLLACAQPDGSIQRAGMANYNTALSLVALTTAFDRNFLPVIVAARRYIAGTQVDMGAKGTNDTPFDGGVGYGSKYMHSDMNNTVVASEAMRVSEGVIEAMKMSETGLPLDDPNLQAQHADLNWSAVAHFVQSCQNLPSHNSEEWVSSDPKDLGGFVYYPGNSMAGGITNSETGRVALRSYGSMSYGGLLSYICAKLEKDDPRVKAVRDWLRANYTIEENPAMGQQGYFYYLHLMTKALTAAGIDQLKLNDGKRVAWRDEVAARLLSLQREDGSWVNPEPRWWEADPVLVTSYAVLTLEMIHAKQKQPTVDAQRSTK